MRHGKPVKANSIAQGRCTSVLWMWMHAVSNFGSGMYCVSKIALLSCCLIENASSYTEMELKARNVQHARNLFDRAVTLLPRIDQLWYKYVYLEELLQNVPGARQVFERWMKWEPDDKAWQAYIKMEERYNELDRASAIYERWVAVRPEPRVWVKWGKYEEDRQRPDKAREVFQTSLEFFGDDEEQVEKAQAVFAAFAKMETRLKEFERARVIYKVWSTRLFLIRYPDFEMTS